MSSEDLYLGTEPMRSGLELDQDAVSSYFQHMFPDLEGTFSISQFKGGQSNPTYCVNHDQQAWVIRRKPPGSLLPSAQTAPSSRCSAIVLRLRRHLQAPESAVARMHQRRGLARR